MSTLSDYQKLFQQAHQTILGSVTRLESVARSYPTARDSLADLSERLKAHLGRQDERFFSQLQGVFAEDRQALKILEFLIFDLKDLKVKYLVFYDRYTGYPTGGEAKSFPKDCRDFSAAVVARLQAEEDYLFPLLRRGKESVS